MNTSEKIEALLQIEWEEAWDTWLKSASLEKLKEYSNFLLDTLKEKSDVGLVELLKDVIIEIKKRTP